jgi:hypothetical protein
VPAPPLKLTCFYSPRRHPKTPKLPNRFWSGLDLSLAVKGQMPPSVLPPLMIRFDAASVSIG